MSELITKGYMPRTLSNGFHKLSKNVNNDSKVIDFEELPECNRCLSKGEHNFYMMIYGNCNHIKR